MTYQRFIASALLVMLLLGITASVVAAANPVVTITVRSGTLFAPTDFTVTYVSDHEALIEWTKGIGANSTMVRRTPNRVPIDRTDGKLIYYGTGESVSDYDIDLEFTETRFHYKAWSEDSGGMWETVGATDYIEGGNAMTLLSLLGFCGIISFLSMRSRFYLLKLLAGAAWVAMFVYWMYNPPAVIGEGTPPHIAIMIVIVGMAVAIPLIGLGREIDTQSDWTKGLHTESSGAFKFTLPGWMKNESPQEARLARMDERRAREDAYRERMHRVLHPPRGRYKTS